MKVLFALPGFHRHDRGAETAFISIANGLAEAGIEVTLMGSGRARPTKPYRFIRAASMARENFESFPALPALRDECAYEELTFVPGLLRHYCPADFDITVTCSYPYTNWILRRPTLRGPRPPHVFVTQNGDWPASANGSEARFFGCDGLVCTNPDFYERNRHRWRCQLIPNSVDCDRFRPGEGRPQEFGLPSGRLVVLMVSALIPSKRVEVGIDAVANIPDAHLVIAGDGPLRQRIDAKAARLLPGRFTRLSLSAEMMPHLYRSADLFLHLSEEESFGNVFLEAMACGLPVVAHESSRLRWIVGDNEFLLDTRDTAAITRHIELARVVAPAEREARVMRAASFSVPRIATLYGNFFHEVIASYQGRPVSS